MRKTILVFAALLLVSPGILSARGGRGFGGGFGYGYGGVGLYNGPFGNFPGYGYGRGNAGQVKLDTKLKDAEVFLNGAYAGTTGSLKSMTLQEGTYTIEIRSPGRTRYAEKVYVIAGRTLRLSPELRVESKP